MDTSKAYIKMCDCPEIQGQWMIPPYDHDFCYNTKDRYFTYGRNISADTVDDYIWLPRQDQIQEMMQFKDLNVLMCDLWAFHSENLGYVLDNFTSMEQLWLAFYMHEKHGKLWSKDGKWVKR